MALHVVATHEKSMFDTLFPLHQSLTFEDQEFVLVLPLLAIPSTLPFAISTSRKALHEIIHEIDSTLGITDDHHVQPHFVL